MMLRALAVLLMALAIPQLAASRALRVAWLCLFVAYCCGLLAS